MVHMIETLKCKNGHTLPISLDENQCGCHHDGKPCLIISCRKCFEEALKKEDVAKRFHQIYIPLDEEGMKAIKENSKQK